jgi:hypothetical protein
MLSAETRAASSAINPLRLNPDRTAEDRRRSQRPQRFAENLFRPKSARVDRRESHGVRFLVVFELETSSWMSALSSLSNSKHWLLS